MGGINGFAGMGASYTGSAIARQGVAKAARARVQPSIDKLAAGSTKDALQKRLDDSIRTAEAMQAKAAQNAESLGRSASTLSSSTYVSVDDLPSTTTISDPCLSSTG